MLWSAKKKIAYLWTDFCGAQGSFGHLRGLIRRLIDRWGRLTRAWGSKGIPAALVNSIAHRQAREVKILMRLPDGRNVAARQAVHGSA